MCKRSVRILGVQEVGTVVIMCGRGVRRGRGVVEESGVTGVVEEYNQVVKTGHLQTLHKTLS